MTSVRLEFRNVTRKFGAMSGGRQSIEEITAVDDVSIQIADGEVVSLIGPSGCGKSTLLIIASGLSPATSGEVYVDGERVTGPNAHVGFMLQKDLLLPWRSIQKNVEFGLEIQGVATAERRERAAAWLDKCHLSEFSNHYPHQLSGGMRQRAALARTLVVDPTVLLLDEPFSALDAQTKMILQRDLAETLSESGKTALFITHDLVEAVALSDRVLVMSQRPGRIIEDITMEMPNRNDPMARRRNDALGGYVARLMILLDIGHAEVAV